MLKPSSDLCKRALRLIENKALVKEILKVVGDIAKVTAICKAMPKHYSRYSVGKWADSYNAVFE